MDDKNNNGIHDKYETVINYIFALIFISIGAAGFFWFDMDTNTLKWILIIASLFTGIRSIIKDILKHLL